MRPYCKPASALLALLALAVGPAAGATNYGVYQGSCSQPDGPYYRGPSKPDKPSCAIMRNCPDWEVSEYRYKSQEFLTAMRKYVADVTQFESDAANFVTCMTKD